jgi:hypothetical protein
MQVRRIRYYPTNEQGHGTVSLIYGRHIHGGVYTITATSRADVTRSAAANIAVTDLASVASWRNDNSRSGVNSWEYALSGRNVVSGTFGKLFSCPVDGWIFAQPLWMANVQISGARRNVVFIATENDSLYAFDADGPGCKSVWSAPRASLAKCLSTNRPWRSGVLGGAVTKSHEWRRVVGQAPRSLILGNDHPLIS